MKHRTLFISFVLCCAAGLMGGCFAASGPRSTVMTPMRIITQEQWSDSDRAQNMAVHDLMINRSVSYHMIRLAGKEELHAHDNHDLAVTIISGQVRMRLGPKVLVVKPGDIVVIPRGMPHAAENLDPDRAAEAFAVFTPPFDPKDNRRVDD